MVVLPPGVARLSCGVPLFSQCAAGFPSVFCPGAVTFVFVLHRVGFVGGNGRLRENYYVSGGAVLANNVYFLLIFLLLRPTRDLSYTETKVAL